MTPAVSLILLVASVLVLVIAVGYFATRWTLSVSIELSRRISARIPKLQISRLLTPLVPHLSALCPRLYLQVESRIGSRPSTGLLLTLLIFSAVYLAGLFSGLVEEVVEADKVVKFDDWIHALFEPLRTRAMVAVSLWISALGDSSAIISAVIIATGFLWAEQRFHLVAPLWIANLGAQVTTWAGKYFVGRQRPAFPVDITAFSPSFPSGHATAAMAVYGFLAYAIARELPSFRQRFEIAYWITVLIGLIGLSRLALGVHFLSDVVGGFLVGGFWLLVGFVVAEWTRPASTSRTALHPADLVEHKEPFLR
jgi:undecaprenyl-diphosphatase